MTKKDLSKKVFIKEVVGFIERKIKEEERSLELYEFAYNWFKSYKPHKNQAPMRQIMVNHLNRLSKDGKYYAYIRHWTFWWLYFSNNEKSIMLRITWESIEELIKKAQNRVETSKISLKNLKNDIKNIETLYEKIKEIQEKTTELKFSCDDYTFNLLTNLYYEK